MDTPSSLKIPSIGNGVSSRSWKQNELVRQVHLQLQLHLESVHSFAIEPSLSSPPVRTRQLFLPRSGISTILRHVAHSLRHGAARGQVRSLVNPPFSGGSVIPAGVATTVIAVIGVCLRCFTRTYVVKGVLGLDDYLSLCALGFSIAFLGVSIHLFDVGGGHHMWDVHMSDYSPPFLQTTIGSTLTFALSIACSKLSILTFYLRISPDRIFRRAVYGLIGLVIAYTLASILLLIFQCQPVSAGWDRSVEGTCIGYVAPMMILGVSNIVVDIVILCLPIKVVLPLQIPVKQKISLGFLFATGGFVCAVAIKRTAIIPPLLDSDDYTWKLPGQIIWSFIEANAGLVCASVPALKPLCVRYLPSLVSNPPRASHYTNSGEKQKRRSMVFSQSYELPSRDELPARTDDEAQLWSNKHNAKRNALQSVDLKLDTDSNSSFDSENEKLPAKPAPVGFGTKRTEYAGGIKITKETFISYTEG
ncbi:hypothetical protein G7046_g3723 [Stylonectria norvegica]|nr:hypothetical protein G7046_g3723 [Stylonectria norvegica]